MERLLKMTAKEKARKFGSLLVEMTRKEETKECLKTKVVITKIVGEGWAIRTKVENDVICT